MTAKKTAKAKTKSVAKQEAQTKKEVKTKLEHLSARARTDVVKSVANKQVNGFADFLREQSVVGLAIGLVLGTQAKQLVDSMVLNFFNPFIGLFLPGKGTLAEQTFTMHFRGKSGDFGYGALVITLVNFLIVAALVYFIFKALRLDKLSKKKDADSDKGKDTKKKK